jgi:protein-tyrosine phosphatase
MRSGKSAVLFVCLGNICRSPTAEGVLRQLLAQEAPDLDVQVDSAGTGDYHLGRPPDLRSQRAALRRGIDLSGLRARQIGKPDFFRFDLILAMDRQNLRDLQSLCPPAAPAQLGLFMEYAGTANLEVPDPYLGQARDFERVLDMTMLAARGLIAALKNRA